MESLGFWWGNSPVSTEKQLTNIIDNTCMRLSEINEDSSMSFLFESIGEFPSAWWQTLTMDEIREMVREIDEKPIDDKIWNTYPNKTPLKKHFFIGTCDFSGDTDLYYLNNDGQCIKPNEENGIVYYIPKFWAYPPKGHGWHNEDTEADAPITPEFLEGVGFSETKGLTGHFHEMSKTLNGKVIVIRCGIDDVLFNRAFVDISINPKNFVDYSELPHIRTQSQLAGLIAALFGGGE